MKKLSVLALISIVLSITGYARMVDITVVRHGQTDWNAVKRLQGVSDIPMNELGLSQATEVSKVFAGKDLPLIYSSDLVRAKQTASAIKEVTGSKIEYDARLRERDHGLAEGLQEFDGYMDYIAMHPQIRDSIESKETHMQRVMDFLSEKINSGVNSLFIVAHGGVINRLLQAAGDALFAAGKRKAKNCAVANFVFDTEVGQLKLLSLINLEDRKYAAG